MPTAFPAGSITWEKNVRTTLSNWRSCCARHAMRRITPFFYTPRNRR
ncbi:hypothetical protein M8494_15620 [Serratia ureilytica]